MPVRVQNRCQNGSQIDALCRNPQKWDLNTIYYTFAWFHPLEMSHRKIHFGGQFRFHIQSPFWVLKSDRKAPRREKRSKKGPKTAPSWGVTKSGKGSYKRLKGSFLHLPVVWCDCGLQFYSFYLFSDLRNEHILLKIWLVSAIYCSLCSSAPDVKQKKREFLPVSHGYGLLLRCPRNRSQCFTSGCKPQFSAGGPFL